MPSNADTIIPLYQRHARAYDRLRGRSLFERPWLDAFAALLRDGGAVLDIGCGMGEPIARDLIARGFAVTGVIGEFEGEPLYHASLDPAEYRALLEARGFDVVRHVAEDPACGGHTVWLARRM